MWKDILKNQISATGLSMRSMDLDNLIDEEEDDCMSKLLNTIENFINKASVDEESINLLTKLVLRYNGPDEHICEILKFLKNLTANKMEREEPIHGGILSRFEIGELLVDAISHYDDGSTEEVLHLFIDWDGAPDNSIVIVIEEKTLEDSIKVVQECVVV